MSKDDLVNGDDILCNTSDSLPRQQWRVFIAQNPVLTTSPALHQNLSCSPPKPCMGLTKRAVILKVSGRDPTTTTKQMTNNKAAKGFIVKSAAMYVAFAAAPFAIALGVSSVFTPPAQAFLPIFCFSFSCPTITSS